MGNLQENQDGAGQTSGEDIKSVKAVFRPSRNKEYAIFSLGDDEERVYVGKYHDTDSFKRCVADYFLKVEHCNLENVKEEKKFLRRPVMIGKLRKAPEKEEDTVPTQE
jgi:hypothetical protein